MPPRRRRVDNVEAHESSSAQPDHVSGPTSALTSFLRAQGIRSRPSANPFRRRNDDTSEPQTEADSGVSTPARISEQDEALEIDEEENAVASTSSSVPAKRKAPSAKSVKAKQKKDADEFEDDLPNKVPKARYDDRKPGSFAICAECSKKFTVTKYTASHPDGNGLLCTPCTKEFGPLAKPSPATTPKPRARATKAKTVLEKIKPSVKSLQKCCIEIIGNNIANVDAFGDIGASNMDKLCQVVCKNRHLDVQTVKLFLDGSNTDLSLYDCTSLDHEGLKLIANFCPNLEKLTLRMCGQLENTVIEHFGAKLIRLRYLELYAPFLVRKEAWKAFLQLHGPDRPLEGFMIRQSPRFDLGCVEVLVAHAPNLTKLQLSELGLFDNECLKPLHALKFLTHLDISHAGLLCNVLMDESVIALLDAVGSNLNTLVLDDNILLTDRVLIDGIKINCCALVHLSLRGLNKLLPTGISGLFDGWVNKGLTKLSLHRCIQLDGDAVDSVIKHSGHSIIELDLNSVDQADISTSMSEEAQEAGKDEEEQSTPSDALKKLADCPNITTLDVSFIRAIDDFLIKEYLDKLEKLQTLYIWGNNRVSDFCPSKAGVKIIGQEQAILVE